MIQEMYCKVDMSHVSIHLCFIERSYSFLVIILLGYYTIRPCEENPPKISNLPHRNHQIPHSHVYPKGKKLLFDDDIVRWPLNEVSRDKVVVAHGEKPWILDLFFDRGMFFGFAIENYKLNGCLIEVMIFILW